MFISYHCPPLGIILEINNGISMDKKNIALSIGTLMVASFLIAGCNEKEQANKNEVQSTQEVSTQQTIQPEQNDEALNQFNQSIKISAVARNLVEDEQKNQGSKFVYAFENTSNKPIQSVRWVSVYNVDSKIIYNADITADFSKQPLEQKASRNMEVLLMNNDIPEVSRQFFVDPDTPMNVIIVAREITFMDGSKIEVKD